MSSSGNLSAASVARLEYRPDIDGLRAVAVLAVVLFHFHLGVPGGYVGVDVFFVISGYLITKLILNDLEKNRFSMVAFWERRVRRLMPAMFVMITVVLVAGYFLLLPEAYTELAESVVWQMFFLSNVYFWITTGYFASAAEEKPLLHTWSLSVEEQFYLLVPLLMLACWRYSRDRLRVVGLFIGMIAVGSFLVSLYAVAWHRSVAFYLLPSRAWELALGGLVATWPAGWPTRNSWIRSGVAAVGLAALLMACMMYTADTPFPGAAALLPCLGTAAVIWAGEGGGGGWTRRLLAVRPLVFIGLISYSLYLWHWPIRAFARYWELEMPTYAQRWAMVGVSVVLAVVSYYLVEQPFRTRRIFAARAPLFRGAAACVAVLIGLAVLVWTAQGVPGRLSGEILAYSRAQADRVSISTSIEDIKADRLHPLGAESASAVDVVIWGDSHAMVLTPAFDEVLKELGLKGAAATYTSSPPLVGFYRETKFGLKSDALEFNREVVDYIRRNRVGHVFIAAHWKFYHDFPVEPGQGDYEQQIVETVAAVVEGGAKPWVMLQVPRHLQNVPKLLLHARMFGTNPEPYLDRPSEWNGLTARGNEIFRKIREQGRDIVDLRPAFYEEGTGAYSALEKSDYPLYQDEQHLTPHGAKLIAGSAIRKALVGAEKANEGKSGKRKR